VHTRASGALVYERNSANHARQLQPSNANKTLDWTARPSLGFVSVCTAFPDKIRTPPLRLVRCSRGSVNRAQIAKREPVIPFVRPPLDFHWKFRSPLPGLADLVEAIFLRKRRVAGLVVLTSSGGAGCSTRSLLQPNGRHAIVPGFDPHPEWQLARSNVVSSVR
jgi:hypothetical protein